MKKITPPIFIGENLLVKINQLFDFSKYSKILILTDSNVSKNWLSIVKKSLWRKTGEIIIKAGENEKNIKTVKLIWQKMFDADLDRESLLINLGGGVICDMGGFAAATFMRGIDFLNIPTTLLAQVDASIGGKTGIDFNEIKNGIGVFKDPIGVIIDTDILKTLPQRELISAFGEIIKYGIISGRKYFDLVTAKKPKEFHQKELIEIIRRSIDIKSNIVRKDVKEVNLRKVLNYGHTIGHAVESLSWKTKQPQLHGEAVAVGMVAEAKLANLLGLLSKKDLKLIEKSIANMGISSKIRDIQINEIIKKISMDKKNSSGKVNWSLPKKIGEVVTNINTEEDLIIKVIKNIQK